MRREFYCGSYKGIDNFCEPYVTKEQWERIAKKPANNIKKTQNNRVYLFRGLIKCPLCGTRMASTYRSGRHEGQEYYSYRCRKYQTHACDFKNLVAERKIEAYLLDNIYTMLQQKLEELEKERMQPKPKTNIASPKEKLRRLNVVYMAGGKSDSEYMAEMAELKEAIAKAQDDAPPPKQNEEKYRQLLASDIKGRYEEMNREEKQRFWRNVVKEIHVEGTNVVSFDWA